MAILPLFTQHSRSWQSNRYVYPVISRRSKGLSIGVNLNPDKICNFDCVYCCVDRTTPSSITEVDLPTLESELDHLLQLAISRELFTKPPFDQTPPALTRINDIAFSGDGEPTSYPKFQQACELAANLLQKYARPDIKLVVITNATLFHQKKVQDALAFLDHHNGEIWAKLDAGTESYYRQIERTSIPLQRVLDNILHAGLRRDIVIQSLFMNLHEIGPSPEELAQYTARLQELKSAGCRIKLVQIYTVARTTAVPWCTPLPKQFLDALSDQVRKATGLTVETYYGPA